MTVRPILFACTVVLSTSGTAAADSAYDACLKAADTNAAYGDCGAAYLQRADAALNAAWRRTVAVAMGRTARDLLEEQRAWVAFKDRSCNFYANGDWGREGQVLSFPGCRGQVIEERTREIIAIGKDLAPR